MKHETIRIWSQESYHYRNAFGFIPRLDAYLHDDDIIRPAIIIVPGGGYRRCAPREGQPVAHRFFTMGYQAVVCTYTTDPLGTEPLLFQPSLDIAQAIRTVRANAQKWKVYPNQIGLCGFSAGGHAAATLAVHWKRYESGRISCKPNALLLSYPVTGVFSDISHNGSDDHLLGPAPSEQMIHYFQLERHVTADCPPTFIWHTKTDKTVNPDNSLRFASALQNAGVDFELHLFSSGDHGLSLADGSIHISPNSLYTLEQTGCVLNASRFDDRLFSLLASKSFFNYPEVKLLQNVESANSTPLMNEEVKNWILLAETWLSKRWRNPIK